MASQLSLYGASARLDRSMRLPRGAAVSLMLGEKDWTCRISALVANSAGRHQHFVFTALGLDQEYYLVNQVYSRPDAWVSWNDSRAKDNPIRSLVHIVWLAIRGMFILSFGLPGLLPTRDRSDEQATKKRERKAALAASIILAFLALTPVSLQASDGPGSVGTVAAQPAVFNEEYEIGVPAAAQTIVLRGSGA